MGWAALIGLAIQVITMIINWLQKQDTLTEKQRKRVNNLIHKCNTLRSTAIARGCTAEGEPDAFMMPIEDED